MRHVRHRRLDVEPFELVARITQQVPRFGHQIRLKLSLWFVVRNDSVNTSRTFTLIVPEHAPLLEGLNPRETCSVKLSHHSRTRHTDIDPLLSSRLICYLRGRGITADCRCALAFQKLQFTGCSQHCGRRWEVWS